jgi:hypothetical protein
MGRRPRTKQLVPRAWYDAMSGVPNWPTTMRSNLGDGRLVGVSPTSRDGIGSVWLYKRVPLSPMVDARDGAELERSVAPLAAAFEALARASGSVGGRRLAEASYREFHVLSVNVPRRFRPPAGHPVHDVLLSSFGNRTVDLRLVLLGVRLVPAVDLSGGLGSAARGYLESLTATGVPLVEFTRDFQRLDAELSRAGLVTPADADVRLANCWWNLGRYADTPMMAHHDHTHIFGTVQSAVRAARSAPEDCEEWTTESVPDQWAVTMASVTDFEVDGIAAGDRRARWVSTLLDMGALCVSLRGKVEPAKVTRGVLRRNRELYQRDIVERSAAGKSSRGEQETRLAQLAEIEDRYANGTAPPTVKGLSTVVGFDGNVPDLRDIIPEQLPLVLAPMSDLQPVAMAETYLCSPARGNPTLHDVPSHVLTYSGLTSLSAVGDVPGNSLLLGFTETDRQPVWMDMSAASNEDAVPICMVPGSTGSGKTAVAQWMAYQAAQVPNALGEKCPVVLFNPKPGQSLRKMADAVGGATFRLDELTSADGAVDPLRFSRTPQDGMDLAVSLLLSVNPWGPARDSYEIPLFKALKHGIDRGAAATGQALHIAAEELNDAVVTQMVEAVDHLAGAVPQFRALVGLNPRRDGLRVSQGLTLIEVGNSHLNLPEPGNRAPDVTQRIALALVRMMVFGTMSALTGRQGVVFLDEGWVFTSAGRAEMDRLGRLARSLEVFPILLTQKMSDALHAGLAGYISRGLIMSIGDTGEARAAFELFKLDPTPERMTRVRAKPKLGGETSDADNDRAGVFDWRSLRALISPDRVVHRGAVGYHVDLAGRCVPVEIVIPDWFIRVASTNGLDIRAREHAERMAAPVGAEPQPLTTVRGAADMIGRSAPVSSEQDRP